ncbi:MAG: hypothetical protein HY542_05210 [Deltaproteobacteria bacterium]|nr:hypothetical protein [Deltaproteobacteria bacterium]
MKKQTQKWRPFRVSGTIAWSLLRDDANKSIPEIFFVEPWTNGKWYLRSGKNDPRDLCQPLYPSDAFPETPAKRRIFVRSSRGRFALPGQPIAYLASSGIVSAAEITDCFRQARNLSLFGGKFRDYLDGKFDPTPEWFLHTRQFFVNKGAVLLDLSHPKTLPCEFLAQAGGWESSTEFYNEVISSRADECHARLPPVRRPCL